MALRTSALPNNQHAKREKETIEIVKALMEAGFTEAAFDKTKRERVFKRPGYTDVRLSVKDGTASYGTFTWTGNRYVQIAAFIKKLITTSN